jgi:LAO/AO transport system kinase
LSFGSQTYTAGFNVVIVESVGLGQSEVDIDAAVDMMILLVPPGGGDGLQASKKGIMEAADLVIVNKADGNLLASAKHTKADYSGAMQFIRRKYHDWGARVLMISAQTGANMDEVEQEINNFHKIMVESNHLHLKRNNQAKKWMLSHFQKNLISAFEHDATMQGHIAALKAELENGTATPRAAADQLMDRIRYTIS